MTSLVIKADLPAPKPPSPPSEEVIMKNWNPDESLPLVSILCHCFNHEKYIEDALNGILMQETNFAWEIIVHDDASTDKSAEIIKDYARRYPSIIKPIYQYENQFSQGNKPILYTSKLVEGEFIAICEGDDYWLDPEKLQSQANFLQENPGYSVCGHDAFIVQNNTIISESKLPQAAKKDADKNQLSRGVFILTLTAMFRNEVDLCPKEISNITNGDLFLFSRLGSIGGYKYLDNIVPGAYRVHSGGIWSLTDQKQRAAHHANSAFWISQYYKRIGNSELSHYFAKSSAIYGLSSTSNISLSDIASLNFALIKRALKPHIKKIIKWQKR